MSRSLRPRPGILRSALIVGLAGFAPQLPAQLERGHSIVAVLAMKRPSAGEIWDVDHATGTATRLAIPPTLRDLQQPNAILMDPASANGNGALTRGWVASSARAEIHEITLQGGTVTARPLNTTASAGGNPSQLALVGNELYFTTAKGNGADGVLQSIHTGGGPVRQLVDLATVGARHPVNACTVHFNQVFMATYNAGTTSNGTGELIAFDLGTRQAAKVMDIPAGGYQGLGFGVVGMHPLPTHPTRLALFGLHGDYFEIDFLQKKVVFRSFTGSSQAKGGENRTNCAHWNPVGRDWIVGTRDGSIDVWVDGHSAERVVSGIGSAPYAVLNSLNGIYHHPAAAGSDVSIGPGCPGPGGFTATDVSLGAPSPGNTGFALGLYSAAGGDPYLLSIGVQALPVPFDLTAIGAPSCRLYAVQSLALLGGVTGTGDGAGRVTIPVPIPGQVPKGARIYRQWLLANGTPVNRLGVTVSNARLMDFK